jgi:Ca-activated chloride channel family protein
MGLNTSVLTDHEPAGGGHIVRLLLRVEAEAVARPDRLPLNLSLVLDRSGSMCGEKMAAARGAAALLVRRLAPEDVVSVVAYDDRVSTVALPAKGAEQADLPQVIERIECGGSTNLSGGWLRGRELVVQHALQQGVNRVLILTDGLANVGITDRQTLTGLCAQAKKAGVTTTTIGFGEDYDEKLLRAMADAGGGNMYYIEEHDQAPSIFNDELQGLLDLGAQNVAVVVEPAAAANLTVVHHDYPSAATGRALRLELGDLYAREPKPLLVEFMVAGDVAASDIAVATLTVTADVLNADGGMERQTVTLPVTVSTAEGARVEPELRRELLLLEAAKARRAALELRDHGDFEGAAHTLESARARLESSGFDDADLAEEASELGMAAASFALADVSAADQKYMYQRAYNSQTGRRAKDALIRRKKRGLEPPAV